MAGADAGAGAGTGASAGFHSRHCDCKRWRSRAGRRMLGRGRFQLSSQLQELSFHLGIATSLSDALEGRLNLALEVQAPTSGALRERILHDVTSELAGGLTVSVESARYHTGAPRAVLLEDHTFCCRHSLHALLTPGSLLRSSPPSWSPPSSMLSDALSSSTVERLLLRFNGGRQWVGDRSISWTWPVLPLRAIGADTGRSGYCPHQLLSFGPRRRGWRVTIDSPR